MVNKSGDDPIPAFSFPLLEGFADNLEYRDPVSLAVLPRGGTNKGMERASSYAFGYAQEVGHRDPQRSGCQARRRKVTSPTQSAQVTGKVNLDEWRLRDGRRGDSFCCFTILVVKTEVFAVRHCTAEI